MDTRLFDVDWLNLDSNKGYGTLPIPIKRDEDISAVLRQWVALSAIDRRESSTLIDEDHLATLRAYSERMASEAVRNKNPELLFLGLLALGIDGWRTDWRENAPLLSLHFDAAAKIGVVPRILFCNAATLLAPDVSKSFEEFLDRASADQTLQAMGYEESADADGFRYKRNW